MGLSGIDIGRALPIPLKYGRFAGLTNFDLQVSVVQKVDTAIHWINLYPLDSVIGFLNIYPPDSDLSGG